MNRSWIDQIKQNGERVRTYWAARSSKQKGLFIGTFLFLFIVLAAFVYFASRPDYVPLYTGQLSQRDVGDIKAELDKEGFTNYQISQNGTVILVPRKNAPDLVVTLASKGYPKDNTINYDVFSQNLSFGATDRQYNILERQAMQNQVADVLKHVDGIKSANVILTLPDNSVFVRQDQQQKASASVMVEVEPGTQLNSQQIRALYTLVSKSVPNLPVENITMMNQYSETLALDDSTSDQSLSKFDQQQKIQQSVQRDIQQNLQSLLGTILGTDKVFVNTYVKLNFDQEKTEEKLVKPTDKNNNGIVVSSDKSSTTYTGKGSAPGGVVGSGSTDVPGYAASTSGGDSNYEQTQDKVNYEVNHINNEIIKSPYGVDDITINVGVEGDPSNPSSVPKATQDNIRNILANTVRTALGHPNLSQSEINQRITVFPHSFAANTMQSQSNQNGLLIGGLSALGALLAGGIIWWLVRRRKRDQLEYQEEMVLSQTEKEPDYFAEADLTVEKQLKKLLEQRPEDFSKVIRNWLNEEEG